MGPHQTLALATRSFWHSADFPKVWVPPKVGTKFPLIHRTLAKVGQGFSWGAMILNGSPFLENVSGWLVETIHVRAREGLGVWLCPIKVSWVRLSVSEQTNLTPSRTCMIVFRTTKYEIRSANLGNKPKRLCWLSGNLTGIPRQVEHSEAQVVIHCKESLFFWFLSWVYFLVESKKKD